MKQAVKKKYEVVAPGFSDKNNPSKMYKPGDDVSHFTADRLVDCVKRGLVKKV